MIVLTARTLGVPRFKDKLPNVKWTGIFGEGGEAKNYGFEDEVSLLVWNALITDLDSPGLRSLERRARSAPCPVRDPRRGRHALQHAA
jgi:hypothetical protein